MAGHGASQQPTDIGFAGTATNPTSRVVGRRSNIRHYEAGKTLLASA